MLVAAVVTAFVALALPADAQKWTGHQLIDPNEPPGAVGRKQLLGSRHRPGHIQPVRISAPSTVRIAAAFAGNFGDPKPQQITVGLQVGEVYRFEVSDRAGAYMVYPTIEVIDRLYPPRGSELRFPVPVELTAEELRLAAAGHFVTRVIYVEDPATALPYREDPSGEQNYFEVDPDQDPVQVAFGIGRPVAILRMGSRTPDLDGDLGNFCFGSPPVQLYADDLPTPASPPVSTASYSAATVTRQRGPHSDSEQFEPAPVRSE